MYYIANQNRDTIMDNVNTARQHTPITVHQFSQICAQISKTTKSLKNIGKELGIDNSAIYGYIDIMGAEAASQYARAKSDQLKLIADETMEIADEPVQPGDSAAVNNKRVRIDTRKWLLSKLVPKTYGDQITVNDERTLPTRLQVELIQPKPLDNKDNELNNS